MQLQDKGKRQDLCSQNLSRAIGHANTWGNPPDPNAGVNESQALVEGAVREVRAERRGRKKRARA